MGSKKRVAADNNEHRAKRTKSPGVRVIGGRIYDSENGKTCHQCRQKTMDLAASCMNMKGDKLCTIKFCHKCLINRYGEKAEEVMLKGDWKCPRCRGLCNCSVCMKKKGLKPTGLLVHTAKATGYSSVSEMLLVNGSECLDHAKDTTFEVASPNKHASEDEIHMTWAWGVFSQWPLDCLMWCVSVRVSLVSYQRNVYVPQGFCIPGLVSMPMLFYLQRSHAFQQVSVMISPRNEGKENSLNGNNESNLNLQNQTPNSEKKELKDMKRKELKEISNGNKVDVKCIEETLKKQTEANGTNECLSTKKKSSKKRASEDAGERNSLCHEDASCPVITAEESTEVKDLDIHKYAKTSEDAKNKRTKLKNKPPMNIQNKEFGASVPLPPCSKLTTVADIELTTEDVGHALQFLEFCAAFGKALNLKKGHGALVLKDLTRERTPRRGGRVHDSLTVRFHIQLLSLILQDMDEESAISSPTNDTSSWLLDLKKCISASSFKMNDLKPDYFDGGDNCYDDLDFSKKLRLLTYLCDEALNTTKLRNWIEEQNANFVEKQKEVREKLSALKDKEKQAKNKLKDEFAKALIAKNGLPLSIAEHDAIVAQIKRDVAEVQAEKLVALELASNKKQRSEATRTVPIILDVNGRVFWKLRGFAGEGNILLQDMECWESVNPSEKWSMFKDEQKQEIEKYISSLRLKRPPRLVEVPQTLPDGGIEAASVC
ncbi:Cell division cycle-associated 7-like protein, partial [Cucurbita argyrosperma subsp. argyrosperma]